MKIVYKGYPKYFILINFIFFWKKRSVTGIPINIVFVLALIVKAQSKGRTILSIIYLQYFKITVGRNEEIVARINYLIFYFFLV